jgi:hypothetical protein
MKKAAVIVKGRSLLAMGALGLAIGVAAFASVMANASNSEASDGASTQLARLYQLQSAFHEAATASAPGETNDVDQRVQDVLALFADDATLTFLPTNTTYVGAGRELCDPGTICDFFSNVAPPFQEANRWVSLSPAYLTSFDIHGNTADMYFECHFFDQNWDDGPHLAVNGTAKKVGGRWLFSEFVTGPTGVPYR